jgi:hypothetical protein
MCGFGPPLPLPLFTVGRLDPGTTIIVTYPIGFSTFIQIIQSIKTYYGGKNMDLRTKKCIYVTMSTEVSGDVAM